MGTNLNLLANNPFAVLTFIAAPALLTNASCLLALSTINRLIRTRDSMHELLKESDDASQPRGQKFIEHVNRVERQASLLLGALHWIYVALGAFVAATLVTLLGAVAGQSGSELAMKAVVGLGLVLGVVGVAGLIGGCVNLFHATQISLVNIREEAETIRTRQEQLKIRRAIKVVDSLTDASNFSCCPSYCCLHPDGALVRSSIRTETLATTRATKIPSPVGAAYSGAGARPPILFNREPRQIREKKNWIPIRVFGVVRG